jgi:membrane protein YdbS with pleckstrin-like domain
MRGVTFPARLLNEGEHVVVSTRTHVKALFLPVLVLLAVAFGSSYLAAKVDDWTGSDAVTGVFRIVVAVLAVVVLVWYVVRPFLRWLTTTYTFTNRRFVSRSGFVAREGRTIPLNRISGVDFEIGVLDRLFGCGTLVVSDASEAGRVELPDVPQVERVQMAVAAELHRLTTGERRSADDGA